MTGVASLHTIARQCGWFGQGSSHVLARAFILRSARIYHWENPKAETSGQFLQPQNVTEHVRTSLQRMARQRSHETPAGRNGSNGLFRSALTRRYCLPALDFGAVALGNGVLHPSVVGVVPTSSPPSSGVYLHTPRSPCHSKLNHLAGWLQVASWELKIASGTYCELEA